MESSHLPVILGDKGDDTPRARGSIHRVQVFTAGQATRADFMWRTYRSCAACKNIKKARKIANPYKA